MLTKEEVIKAFVVYMKTVTETEGVDFIRYMPKEDTKSIAIAKAISDEVEDSYKK